MDNGADMLFQLHKLVEAFVQIANQNQGLGRVDKGIHWDALM
jgi:hypothetical protein